jgi:uncharacterized protein YndB with AHSA1/START domain
MAMANDDDLMTATPSDRELVWTRVFNAPRRLVFDAWTKPELILRWQVPEGWTMPVCEFDVRPGGSYRQVMRRESDGFETVMGGEFREVERPARWVFTNVFDGFTEVGWRPQDVAVVTMELTEQAGKTTWKAAYRYPSREARDAVLLMGINLERFDQLLVELQGDLSATKGPAV